MLKCYVTPRRAFATCLTLGGSFLLLVIFLLNWLRVANKRFLAQVNLLWKRSWFSLHVLESIFCSWHFRFRWRTDGLEQRLCGFDYAWVRFRRDSKNRRRPPFSSFLWNLVGPKQKINYQLKRWELPIQNLNCFKKVLKSFKRFFDCRTINVFMWFHVV